jgi:hypothetical protein
MPARVLIFLLSVLAVVAQTPAPKRLDAYILLPEPSALRSHNSRPLGNARKTVITPAHEIADAPGVKAYTKEEFEHLGISVTTFTERAAASADARLKTIQPEFIKDDSGKTRYAVFRGDSSLIATLIMAPSLATTFTKMFAGDVWAVLPDRHSLYIFPTKPELLAEFTDDLLQRYKTDPFAASSEVFLIKPGEMPSAVATFDE